MEILVQAAFVLGVLIYGIVLSRLIPMRYHLVANLSASAFAIFCAISVGLNFEQLGLSIKLFWPGIFVALTASVFLIISIYLLSKISFTHKYFVSSHSALRASPSRLAYETAVRIPLSTALAEEILFRGVLFGVLLYYSGTHVAIIGSSLVFGLWHIFPALNFTNESYYLELRQGRLISKLLHIVVNVLATALAGIVFAWLRLLSGSIIAPWLLHWTINSTTVLSSLFVVKRRSK